MNDGGAIHLNHVEEPPLLDAEKFAVLAETSVVDEQIDFDAFVAREGEDPLRRCGISQVRG